MGEALADFFALPWPNVFAFTAFLSLILFTFGPKVPLVAGFFASGIQDMLGVTALRGDMKQMHADNQAKFENIDQRIDKLMKVQEIG